MVSLVHAILGIRPPARNFGRATDSQDRMDLTFIMSERSEENVKPVSEVGRRSDGCVLQGSRRIIGETSMPRPSAVRATLIARPPGTPADARLRQVKAGPPRALLGEADHLVLGLLGRLGVVEAALA